MIKLSSPEILIAGSCILFCVGQTVAGAVFGTLGVVGAILRVAIENSVRIEQSKRENEMYGEIRKAGNAIADALSSFTAVMAQRDYDDSDIN